MKNNGSMNRCYRLVWSQVQQAWMAVAETTRGRGKASSSVGSGVAGTVKAVMGASLGAVSLLGAPAHAAPQGGQVTAGSASVSQSGTTTTIAQSSQNVSLSWQRFNVGAAETVNFVQPSAAAIAVNRIADTQGSQILGHINANGQVWLINPNGVLFGRDAQINVGALVASTLDVADGDLANGTRRFAGSSSASVVNQGHITAAPGGYVSLLGHQVINQGAISARLGTVALGAGNAISLNFSGSRLLGLQVEQSALNALADNGGLIQAAGGQVLLSAGARDSVLASVVNNTGVIEATTVQEHEGTIVLLGGMAAGTTNVGGTLDASAASGGNGGFIETSAHRVNVADGTRITTASAQGQQGQWLIDPYDFYIAASGGNITGATLSAALGSNSVTIETTDLGTSYAGTPTTGGTSGNGDIFVNDSVSWSANTLTLSAWNNIHINAALNGSGTASLAFAYGQGAPAAGNTSSYTIHAAVSLPAGDNFSTKQGSDGAVLGWKVITTLGDVGSTTGADLQGINGGLTGRYVLGADIDASATVGWNAGAGFAPIGASAFTGSFDGLGHSIGHLTINRSGTSNVGLFGVAGTGSVIRNVGVTDADITGQQRVGALAGSLYGAISNSYATGSVSGTLNVGGLVGYNFNTITDSHATASVSGLAGAENIGGLVGRNSQDGSITNGYATGSVSGIKNVGGLVGRNSAGDLIDGVPTDGGTIANSYATGSVSGLSNSQDVGGLVGWNGGNVSNSHATGSVSGTDFVGGLVGFHDRGVPLGIPGAITNSYATGSVTGTSSVGGLVGWNDGTINDGYATGSVIGGESVGGLVGSNRYTISSSYATGSVAGAYSVGGLVGDNFGGSAITNSFWDVETTGQANGVGNVANGSSGATRLTTAQLAAALPTGFLSSVWGNGDNQTTPYLLSHSVFSTTSGSVLLGSDSSTTPTAYQVILNVTQLQNINTTGLAGNYVLGSNIDASATVGWNTVAGFAPIGTYESRFTGRFDGLGHSIGHLTINRNTNYYVGLFGATGEGSVIRNVGLTDVDITGGGGVGALVGFAFGGSISNSYATGSVIGGGDATGGLVGGNGRYSTIALSYATGTVNSVVRVGGLVGWNQGGTISNSYATGNVSGLYEVGGLAGRDDGTIGNSYATGNVSGTDYVGGLVGGSQRGNISNSYATGSVSGSVAADFVGGLMGYNSGAIGHSYWDVTTNPTLAGIGGELAPQTGTTGLTTAEMRKGANFTSATSANGNVNPGWDFANTWVIYEDHTSPLLRSFMTPLTVTANNATAPKVYDGTRTYAGGTASYSVTPDSRLLGTQTYTQDSKDAGSRTITPGGLWSDQQGYLISYASGSLTVDKATLTATASATAKDYDGNTTAAVSLGSFVGLVGLETLGSTAAGTFDTKDAGTGKTVTVNSLTLLDGTLGGLASNYQLASGQTTTANINKATLTYTPNAATFVNGQTPVGLSGSVLGFVSGDTLANSTTGTLGWSTPATSSSAPGIYRIDGGGLTADNYVFAQASGPDAGVLTLRPSTLPPQVVSTITQLFDSIPDSLPGTAKTRQQQSVQPPSSLSATDFKGLSIDGPGVKLPPTLIGSAQ